MRKRSTAIARHHNVSARWRIATSGQLARPGRCCQQRGHVGPPVAALGGNPTSSLCSVRCSVGLISGHGGVPPCPGSTRLSRGARGSCGARPLRDPLRGPSGLHRVLFCKVAASRCAKAPLCGVHRFAPSRVYKTHPMQSTFAGYGRTAVGAPRSLCSALRAASWLPFGCCGTVALVRRSAQCSGQWPAAIPCVCAPPTLVGLAAARRLALRWVPVRPQGAPSTQRKILHAQSLNNAAGASRLRCSRTTPPTSR